MTDKKIGEATSYILDDMHTLNEKIKGIKKILKAMYELSQSIIVINNDDKKHSKLRDWLLFALIIGIGTMWWLR